MDVKFSPEEWQGMKDGLDALTGGKYGGGAKSSLLKLNDLLEDIESKIKDKDSDRAIGFSHSSKKSKIEELFKDYQKLSDFCLKAGSLVADHIDDPFHKKMDAFADKMEAMSIRNYKTKNRIGSKETTYVGYGMNKQAVQEDKREITVDDIFKDSKAFDHVLNEEYKAFKAEHPEIELTYEDYSKAIVSARGFEYESITDVQKGQELWRDLILGGGVVVLTIFCAPAGFYAGAAVGGLSVSNSVTGQDWGTRRKLSTDEQVISGITGTLEVIPGLSGAKALQGSATIGKVSGKTEHVIQSFKESSSIWTNRMRAGGLKAQDKLNDAGFAIKKQFAKSTDALTDIARGAEAQGSVLARKGTDFHGSVNDAHKASKSKIQDSISRIEREIEAGRGVGKGTSESSVSGNSKVYNKVPNDLYAYLQYKKELLKDDIISNSNKIINGADLWDQKAVDILTKDGSNISDWWKMESRYSYQTEFGEGKIHFYQNFKTGEISSFDSKLKVPKPRDLRKDQKDLFWIVDLDENFVPAKMR
ncbi:hypothetical protein P9D34_17885 [Bacillus swezeyi]|uniref:hypothetical protein n=1 Tax=Bacillus swezeyi TaxID=1925020 RepID=UPI0013016278|nr:hypothetical protein [Bacillus swezeyi]MEC1262253.1 hypothetical protein [Bacillus swezeyi]MED2927179.1 hypothetical protein [Bacillus swezeyi]MED2962377.1 hypothetical protein [Bacillus swezeyi]MED3072168.1 hypothetical protein [Bacillus swezeyi]MED3084347.1 hypothetical protein [Bacillus swezeyi]